MEKTIKVLAVLPALMPSTNILVVEPLLYLLDTERIELRIRLENLDVHSLDLEWADLVIFCRNTEPAYDLVASLRLLRKPYIYELDDNFFELPSDTPESVYYSTPERIAQLEKYIKHAGLVRVYSQSLEIRLKEYTARVKLIQPPVNLSHIPATAPSRDRRKLKIVFSTSRRISDNRSQIFIKDLIRVLREHGKNIEVHFWGFIPEELRGLPSVKFRRFTPNYQKYMQAMYDEAYDIGLAPMKNDLFHNSKTNNKFREYGACWIAGIYSSTDLYSSCVVDGKTGLLVSNEADSWYQAIIRLMGDTLLRQNIQAEARAVVEREYSLNTFAQLLCQDMEQILSTSYKPTASENNEKHKAATLRYRQNRIPSFYRITKLPISSIQKIYESIRSYGWSITCRLMLEQLEHYIDYLVLSRRVRRKKT
jgi:glycosyltransferase involved in cell wall biosynthesis